MRKIIKTPDFALLLTLFHLALLPLIGRDGNQDSGRYANVMTKTAYNYFLYLPEEYALRPQDKWPLIIYLHGGNPRGDDFQELQAYGIPYLVAREKKEFPFVIVAPQCRKGLSWDREEWFEPFFAEIKNKYRIDPERVYLTGSSMGGTGTLFLAEKHPETFAALAPMCGRIRELDLQRGARLIKHIPTWIFHGAKDRNVPLVESQLMVKELKRHLGVVELTVFPDLRHANFTEEVYAKPFLYEWFLKYRQSDRYDNGQKKYQGVFRENEKHGKWDYWYSNGIKEREEEYVNGLAHGKWQYWDSRGKKCGQAAFVAGTGVRVLRYENGNKEREERFKNGKKDGKWFYWFEDGKPEKELEFKGGLAHGVAKGWFASGIQEFDYNWFEGKPHGKCLEWYPSGNKKDEGAFERGSGTVIRFSDDSGKKLVEQNYKDDRLHGKLIIWNREGAVVIEEIYEDGKLVKKIK